MSDEPMPEGHLAPIEARLTADPNRRLVMTRRFNASPERMFDAFAKAGLSPLRVLQTTTLDGAEYLDSTSTMGTVEPGKVADLVVLEANPIESVQNLHRVLGVMRAGQYFSDADLATIEQDVAAARSVN